MGAAAEYENAIANLVTKRGAQVGDVFVEFVAGLHDELGGGGRGGGAHVGDEVSDSEIGFVTHAGNEWNYGVGDGAGDDFLIEGPDIFERAAAARDDQDVHGLVAIEKLDGANDLRGGAIALHAHGIKSELHVVEAAAEDAHHVPDGGPSRRSDQADAARQKRQRLFALRGEQPFGIQALLELLES